MKTFMALVFCVLAFEYVRAQIPANDLDLSTFNLYDLNKNGRIDITEAEEIYRNADGNNATISAVEKANAVAFMNYNDFNGDGKVTFDEYLQGIYGFWR